MDMYFIVHGTGFEIEGPYLNQREAANARSEKKLNPERSRIFKIGAGPGGMSVNGRSRLSDGTWVWGEEAVSVEG